jgi:catalase
VKTPVFVRFSTVAGSRGSTDLARDIRGFAVKFYTEEGNYDLVGNNAPVFFIQDSMKFPDLVHSVKPEPHNEIPQAAHDTFWDFISLMPESMHAIFWAMSDRAVPRSFRMMEGFGVHTFRFINEAGESNFVKFHWKPLLGLHSVLWDEATRISGKDPDFHRRDLWEAIEAGAYPEWEFGVQIVPEADEHKFEFDLLDPTKIHSRRIGARPAHRENGLKPQSRQLFRRNRTGRFSSRAYRSRHRFYQRPALARAFVFLPRHAIIAFGRPEFSRDSDQSPDRAAA